MNNIEAMKRWRIALQVAENIHLLGAAYTVKAIGHGIHKIKDAGAELDQAIKKAEQAPPPRQTEQDPVYLVWMKAHCAWMHTDRDGFDRYPDDERWMLYTSPPPRQPEQAQPVAVCEYCEKERPVYSEPPRQPEQCTWSQVDDEHTPDTWAASCGAMWTFTDGGPKDNDMHFCHKCGKPAIEAAHGIR